MKRDNCIDVKHVSHLSVAYLTRFFGSVGQVAKVEKDEVSRYVTIEFSNPHSVDKAFRFNGRVLDSKPIKIRKLKEDIEIKPSQSNDLYQEQRLSPRLYISQSTYSSLHSMQELWDLIVQEVKPHHFQKDDERILSMMIASLLDLLLLSAKHTMKFKVNMRSNYIKNELERLIIDKLTRKSNNAVFIKETRKSFLEWREWRGQSEALVWFSVPFPNLQEEQVHIESESSMTKCINCIKNGLSLRLAEIVYVLNAASLCFNLEETGSKDLVDLRPKVETTEKDHFEGIVDNLGAKDIFHQFSGSEKLNTCIYFKENYAIKTFQCTHRFSGCKGNQFQDTSWFNMYRSQLTNNNVDKSESKLSLARGQRIQHIQLDNNVLIFEYDHFSLEAISSQLHNFNEILQEDVMIFYLTRELQTGKAQQFKTSFQNDHVEIIEKMQQVQASSEKSQKMQQEVSSQENLFQVIQIEIKPENIHLFDNLKLTHYLQEYIEESVTSKGLVIPSRDMALRLAANVIERSKDNRLFESKGEKFEQFVGDELWRVYNRHNERKIKSMLTKYARKGK